MEAQKKKKDPSKKKQPKIVNPIEARKKLLAKRARLIEEAKARAEQKKNDKPISIKADSMSLVTTEKFKRDVRNPQLTVGLSDNNRMQNTTPAIVNTCQVDPSVFNGVAHAMVNEAYMRGYANSDNPNNPFLAYNYFIELIQSFAFGSTPIATAVPKFLALYLHAIRPKQVSYKNGMVAYKFFFTPLPTAVSQQQIGPPQYSVYTTCYVPGGGNNINVTIPALQPPTVAYTSELGASAFNSLIQFLASTGLDQFALVQSTDPNMMSSDVSAFSIVKSSPGGGFAKTGGYGTYIANEVFIRCPLMACHVPVVDGEDQLYRWTQRSMGFSGNDTNLLGGYLMRARNANVLKTKAPSVIKGFDANQLNDVLFRALTFGLKKAAESPEVQEAIITSMLTGMSAQDSAAQILAPYTLQLTILEAQILMRSIYMLNFRDSQAMVQALYPIMPESSNSNHFVAYTVSAGTYPMESATPALLPVPFVECLRASTMVTTKTPSGIQAYLPCIGAYYQDQLDASSYVVNFVVKDQPVSMNLFSTAEPPDQKGKMPMSPQIGRVLPPPKRLQAESPISMFDGQYNGVFYAINDPGTLSLYADAWNECMNGPISDFIAGLDYLGVDGGIRSLRTLGLTTYFTTQVDPPVPPPDDGGKPKHPRLGENLKRLKNIKMPVTNYYDSRMIVGISCQEPPNMQAWENVLSYWVKPIMLSHPGNTLGTSMTFQRGQCVYEEPYSIPISQETGHTTLGSQNNAFAEACTRACRAPPSKLQEFLTEAAAQGRGGILSNFLGGVIPLASQTASQLVPLIPY